MAFEIGNKVTPTQANQQYTVHVHGDVFRVKTILDDSDALELDNGEIVMQDNWEVIPESNEQKKEKIMVAYHVTNDNIVLNYLGKTILVANDDKRYSAVLECIKTKRLDDIPSIVEIEKGFEGSGIELRDGLLYEGENPFPTELSDRILKFKDQGIPYAPLFAFWDRVKKNPSYNARKMLFKFLEHNGHPLTEDGLFIAYRGVTDDFKDKHTRKFDNSPGAVCSMPRDSVDDNPNNTCSNGLHVACFNYAKDFGSRLVEVKVDPQDVVAVPTDYNGTKMRVCKFEVVQECANMREELVYGKTAKSVSLDEEEDENKCQGADCENDADECSEHCQECHEYVDGIQNFCGECGSPVNGN